MNKLFLLCFCSLAFIACKRKGAVSGKVTNVFDGKPAEGIGVKISASSDLSSGSDLQTATTDAAGNFKINAVYNTRVSYDYFISLNPNENYIKETPFTVKDTVSAISKTYLYYTSHYVSLTQDIKDVKKTKDAQTFEFNVAPCARLKIATRNDPPSSDQDKITVSLVDKKLRDGGMVIFTKTNRDMPAVGAYNIVPTSGTVSIKWVVNANSKETVYYDTIPVAPFTKNTFYLAY